MLFLSIVHHYLLWHYSRAWLEMLHLWKNFLWFVINFFSIPQLMRSWFSPFKRIVEDRGNTWSFEDLVGFIVIGIMTRFIGAILRTMIIFVGLLGFLLTFTLGLLVFLAWIAAPILIIVLLVGGVALLFS